LRRQIVAAILWSVLFAMVIDLSFTGPALLFITHGLVPALGARMVEEDVLEVLNGEKRESLHAVAAAMDDEGLEALGGEAAVSSEASSDSTPKPSRHQPAAALAAVNEIEL
jgi:hypothetical protein